MELSDQRNIRISLRSSKLRFPKDAAVVGSLEQDEETSDFAEFLIGTISACERDIDLIVAESELHRLFDDEYGE